MSAVVLHMVRKSPQVEEGHVRIANELYDAILAFSFKGSLLKVVLAVMRKTYGYGKKEDDMSASQLGDLCGMTRQHVTTALNDLASINVIHKRPGRYGAIIGLNKDYSSWIASPKSDQVSESRTSPKTVQVSKIRSPASPKSGQVGSPKSGHTITNFPITNSNTEPTDVGSCPDQLPLSEPAETPPPVVLLPLQDGSEFPVTKDLATEWSVAFKQVDVEAQLLRMRVWLIANTRERKTRRGILRFINSWLSRSARDVADGRRPAANPTVSGASRHTNFQERTYVGTDIDSIAWAQ